MNRNSFRWVFIFLALSIVTPTVTAQLDPGFGIAGRVDRTLPGSDTPVKSFLLPDGKILVLIAKSAGPGPSYSFVRLNADGTTDTGYGINGEAQIAINFTNPCCISRAIWDAVRQPDGKIVLVGGDGDSLILRVNEDGTPDNSFSGDGVDRQNASATDNQEIVIGVFYQPDGKLVLYGRSSGLTLMRYQSNGTLDPTFGNQGMITHSQNVSTLGIAGRQSDGKIVIAVGPSYEQILRYNTDGSLDNTFPPVSLPVSPNTRRLFVLSNDKMLAVDSPTAVGDLRLLRFNSDGTSDTTFNGGQMLTVDVSHRMPDRFVGLLEKSDGSLVVASHTNVEANRTIFTGGYLSLIQLDSTGGIIGRSLATGMSLASFNSTASSNLVLQPDGKFIVSTLVTPPNDPNNFFDVFLSRHTGVPLSTYKFRAVPFDFALNTATGRATHAVYRPSDGRVYIGTAVVNGFPMVAGDILAMSDYTGGFTADLAFYRPSTGTWYISGTLFTAPNFGTVQWGIAGDIPVPYDYDGDGKSDVAVYRPSDGKWYLRFQNGQSSATHQWGIAEDKPVPGDYDGDGKGDVAVWRPSTGVWYIYRSSDGQATISPFGMAGDIPVAEDYDGDQKTDIAVWRPSTGVWYIFRSSDFGYSIHPFGQNVDVPTPADYDGDKKVDVSVWRSGTWYQYLSGTSSVSQFPYGVAGDIPLEGRY
jgi:uncharacterized delta-60 repeat protein